MTIRHDHSSMLERAVLLVAVAALLAACGRRVGRTHRRRRSSRPAGQSPHEQVWEGEGGRPVGHVVPDPPSHAVPAPPAAST